MVKGFDKETGQLLVYEIKSINSKIEPHVIGDNIFFEVKIESEGYSEHWMMKEKAFENEFLKRVRKSHRNRSEAISPGNISKDSKAFTRWTLPALVINYEIKYPKVWKKVKKDWDTTFSKFPVRSSAYICND